jgi:hypothetical protein
MNNEKYLNYYIETMTATLTDCVVRNVSLQANAKVTEEVIVEQSKLIEELRLSLEQKNNSDVQLIDELRKNSILSTGKKYGVSDNAVRKWMKRYGIHKAILSQVTDTSVKGAETNGEVQPS